MVLVLSQAEVRQALGMQSTIDAVMQAHIMHSQGKVVMPTRLVMTVEGRNRVNAMPAFIQPIAALGMKSNANFPSNTARGLPAIHGLIILWDAETGVPLALMDGSYITAARTAAASAVATRLLAREDASRLAIIGAGIQGQSHLQAISLVRRIRDIRVYDLDPARAERLAHEARTSLDIPASVTASVADAVRGADIVVTVTPATDPILAWDWLQPGTHINGIGSHTPNARELPTEVVTRSHLVVDSIEATFQECGDILIPVKEGALDRAAVDTELGEVAAGTKPGRRDQSEITLYKAVGVAVQDIASAQLAYQRALELGLGVSVPL